MSGTIGGSVAVSQCSNATVTLQRWVRWARGAVHLAMTGGDAEQ
ncbi:MAG TPA: hypothetical protein VKZ41_13165 [Gemmatimonadales bacterium]|nr:hypothetical protein [Gemmatimonadales bacterium]